MLVADWFGKKTEVQQRVWRSMMMRFAGHEAVRMLFAGAAVVACFHFGNNVRYARHVQIDCEEPKVEGFVLRAGRRNITDSCGGASVWVDSRAPIKAIATNRVTQQFASIDEVPVDRQGNKMFHLAAVERRPWACSIKRAVPDDPRRCNEAGKERWRHASRVRLALNGDQQAATEELRFVLQSEDPTRYGIGVAGVGGCVVSPAESDSPVVELEATPDCVKLQNDGKKAVELVTFLCSNGPPRAAACRCAIPGARSQHAAFPLTVAVLLASLGLIRRRARSRNAPSRVFSSRSSHRSPRQKDAQLRVDPGRLLTSMLQRYALPDAMPAPLDPITIGGCCSNPPSRPPCCSTSPSSAFTRTRSKSSLRSSARLPSALRDVIVVERQHENSVFRRGDAHPAEPDHDGLGDVWQRNIFGGRPWARCWGSRVAAPLSE